MGTTRTIKVAPGDSLQTAFNALMPGDVLELQAGTHPAPNYPGIDRSGTASNWIVVRGASGTRPVIDLKNSGELHVGGSYLLIENLDVVNGAGNNIHVTPTSSTRAVSHVILRNVRSAAMASGTGAAIKLAGQWNNGSGVPTEYVTLEGCEFTGSIDNALVDAVGVRHAVVRGCYLHDAVTRSMKSPGIFFKGGSSDTLIEGNLIAGIRGNAAIMVGGDTGSAWFDALYANPKVEGVNQVIRNNLLADFDDAAFEIRGAHGVTLVGNTIVAQTSFVIFRFSWGGAGSGTQIGNKDVTIDDNLILTTGSARYAQNDGNADLNVAFGRQLWGGNLASGYGTGIPALPMAGDVKLASGASVLVNASYSGLTGLPDAIARFKLASGSPAKGLGKPSAACPQDILGNARSASAPSVGAFE